MVIGVTESETFLNNLKHFTIGSIFVSSCKFVTRAYVIYVSVGHSIIAHAWCQSRA